MHRPASHRAQDARHVPHPHPAVRPPAPRDPLDAPTRPQLRLDELLGSTDPADAASERVVLDEPTITSDGVGQLVAFAALVVALVVFVLWVLPYLLVG